jgi:hypothetical protein
MRIPGADEAIEHLARWAGRGRWKEERMHAIAAHFEPVCAKSGISEDELAEILGEFHYEMVEACAFEDFCSRRPALRRATLSTTTSTSAVGRNRSRPATICAHCAAR